MITFIHRGIQESGHSPNVSQVEDILEDITKLELAVLAHFQIKYQKNPNNMMSPLDRPYYSEGHCSYEDIHLS